MHYRALIKKKGVWEPYDEDEAKAMKGGLTSLLKCKVFTENYRGAVIEKLTKKANAFGIFGMHGTLDINNNRKKIMIDLKTTSAATEEEFISKAIKLSYPRQGCVYEELSGHKESIFIGISKKNIGTEEKPHYPIFLFETNNYGKEKDYAREEVEYLLNFYKTYGLPSDKYIKREHLEGSEL